MLASFIVPSRGRVARLGHMIDCLRKTATKPSDFEILVRADDDDRATIDFLCNPGFQFNSGPRTYSVIGPRGRGYLDLHLMVNDLTSRSNGEFIVLWNDDAEMLTQGWDDVLRSMLSEPPRVYKPVTGHERGRNIFPIVHRSIYEAMGRFSESCLNDFYMEQIARRCDIEVPIDIEVKHSYPRSVVDPMVDATYREAWNQQSSCKHDDKDPRIVACIDEDVIKVQALLNTERTPV